MKKTFLELANYQKWANDRFRKNLKEVDFAKLLEKTTMPYGSILSMVAHIFGAVEIWLKRLEGTSLPKINSGESFHSWDELEKAWIDMDNKLIEVVNNLKEEEFSKRIKYRSTEGLDLETSMENILIQLVTHHQSYHRGQIGMAIRQLNLPPVQETDFIYYVYDQKKN